MVAALRLRLSSPSPMPTLVVGVCFLPTNPRFDIALRDIFPRLAPKRRVDVGTTFTVSLQQWIASRRCPSRVARLIQHSSRRNETAGAVWLLF